MQEIQIIDILKIIAVLIALVGLFLNAWQLYQNNNFRRSEIVSNVLFKTFDDEKISKMFYKLEYDKFTYDDNFHNSKDEERLDKTLVLFNILAKQYYMNLITLEDIEEISYDFLTIYDNQEVQKYLKFLDNWYKNKNHKKIPFEHFRKLSEEIKKHHLKTYNKS